MMMAKDRKNWKRLSGIFVISLLAVTATAIESARAGPDEFNDRYSRCAWVNTSEIAGQMPRLTSLHAEPDEKFLVHEDVNIITGLYTRSYSLHQDGIIDYKTARQIIISEYNEYWNSVVQTKEYPLLYWEDADHDGEFEMWVDQQGYGSPCDIVPYQINETSPNLRSIGLR